MTTRYAVKGQATFTLGDDCAVFVREDVIGTLDDESIAAVINDTAPRGFQLRKNDILHRYGVTEPAGHLQLPDQTIVPVNIPFEQDDVDLKIVALERSSSGDFVHITESLEKSGGWEGWKRYSITLDESEDSHFDLALVSVQFEDGLVFAYYYDGIPFQEIEDFSTSGKSMVTRYYFNHGGNLRLLDDDILGEMFEADITGDDMEAVRSFLKNRMA